MVNLRLSWLRFIRRGSGLGLTVAVIMVMQATLVITAASLPLVETQAVAQKVKSFSVADQWIEVNLGDASKLNNSEIADLAKANLAKFGNDEPRHFIAFRPVSDQLSGRYQLVGTDQADAEIDLTSGRMPTECNSQYCEVVVVNESGLTQIPTGFTEVGRAKLKADSPITATVESETPLLIANNSSSVSKLTNFVGFPGTEIWATKLTNAQIQSFGLNTFLATSDEVRNTLALESGQLQLLAPIGLLEKTKAQVSVLFKRIISLELAICLIGSFAVYLTTNARREKNELFVKSAKRLHPQKISRSKLNFVTALLVAKIGTLIGLFAGLISFLSLNKSIENISFDFLSIFVIGGTSFLLTYAGLSESSKTRILFCCIALLAWVTFIYSNNLQPHIAIISLLAAGAGLVLFRLQNRFFRSKFVKNIFLSSREQAAAFVLIATFLVTSLLSALSYLNSLQQNAIDNAIFKSPTSARVTMGGEALPMQNNSFADYSKYSSNGEVFDIRKVSTTFQENALKSFPTQLIGMNPKLWNYVPDITNQTDFDLKQTKNLLPNSNDVIGQPLRNINKITAAVSGLNEHTTLSVWVLNNRSESNQIEFTNVADLFEASIPVDAISLLGFQITELPDFKSRREHAVGEGVNALPVPSGTISISDVRLNDLPAEKPIEITSEYSVFNGPAYFSLVEQPTQVNAVVDPETSAAAIDNKIQLKITNEYSVLINVVGVANRLPTVPMRFALVNDNSLTQVLAARNPELLNVTEVWLENQLVENLSREKELYGLTIFDQSKLKDENFSPTNSVWTFRGVAILIFSAVLLFTMLLWSSGKNLLGNPQIFGWTASGEKQFKLQRSLIIRFLFVISTALAVATISSRLLVPFFIENLAFDINGDIASPPLVTVFNWQTTGIILLSLISAATLILIANSTFQSKKSGN